MAQQSRLGKTATSVFSENGNTYVQYHSTRIVTFNAKEIVLDSRGWKTATTKTRMNQASNQFGLGYYVTQKDFNWFVGYKRKVMDFSDGMVITR